MTRHLTNLEIAIEQRHGSLPVAVELTVNAQCAEGEAWEVTAVTRVEAWTFADCDTGRRFMPFEWTAAIGAEWLRWLRELDPETVVVDYGLRSQRTLRFQDACEEAHRGLVEGTRELVGSDRKGRE